ncbi:DNA/RNA non-specific endonuclease [Streptomyces sp. NPDC056656]|uniref:DNA/RNA non-specific endonuclease n=1 Tax=Streptomyces sp. NPDC056656 TaxID=3345895 RepID=UPI0036C77549
MKTTSEKKANGTLVSSHTYAYDPNGNKAQDVAKKMNADDHAAYLSSTTDYSYDPADRLAKSVKTGNGAGTETYVHDDNANVVSQTLKGTTTTTTTYQYDRNRLLSATTDGVTANYNYDPFGRQESTTSGGKVIERSVYDGFDHVVESQNADDTGALKSTTYTFDPLDRTASKTADGKTTDYNYLGLASEILDERVGSELTKSYKYSPWGQRLSQIKHNSDGTTEDGYYGYNSHTDVETLTDKNGDAKATYGYSAYGKNDESEFTGIDKPDTADPTKEEYSPYRFNAKRWDAQSGTYDMGFRDYNPGLNRFTTRDMYNGALADMGLGADPYTGNRYAFTGGNPTSSVEIDGHFDVGGYIDKAVDVAKEAAQGVVDEVSDTPTKIGLRLLGRVSAVSIAVGVFLDAVGFNSPTAPNGYESEPGAKPDYNKGLLVKPGSEKEWQAGDARFPFTRQDCDGGQSMLYYMPLDGAGRAQGAIGCLNRDDINTVDKKTGEVTGLWGSATVWPTTDPLYIPKAMQKGGPLHRKGLDRGHLIANRFGGSGQDIRNLAPMYPRINQRVMSRVEDAVGAEIKAGNTVYYQVMVNYPTASDPMPARFDTTWQSSSGAGASVPINNTP